MDVKLNKPAHDKTYNQACMTSKDSDKPVHPPSMARVLFYPSLDSLEAVKVTTISEDSADAQADLSLHWSHKFYCRFCCTLAQIYLSLSH